MCARLAHGAHMPSRHSSTAFPRSPFARRSTRSTCVAGRAWLVGRRSMLRRCICSAGKPGRHRPARENKAGVCTQPTLIRHLCVSMHASTQTRDGHVCARTQICVHMCCIHTHIHRHAHKNLHMDTHLPMSSVPMFTKRPKLTVPLMCTHKHAHIHGLAKITVVVHANRSACAHTNCLEYRKQTNQTHS